MLVRTIVTITCCAAAVLAAWQPPAPTAAAAAPPAQAGNYKGKTRQGRVIAFRLTPAGLDLRHFSIRLRCRDGSVLIDQESGFEPASLRGNGSFREVQYGSTDKVWFRGRTTHRRVRGRIRVKDHWGKIRCNSGWVRFTARRRG